MPAYVFHIKLMCGTRTFACIHHSECVDRPLSTHHSFPHLPSSGCFTNHTPRSEPLTNSNHLRFFTGNRTVFPVCFHLRARLSCDYHVTIMWPRLYPCWISSTATINRLIIQYPIRDLYLCPAQRNLKSVTSMTSCSQARLATYREGCIRAL